MIGAVQHEKIQLQGLKSGPGGGGLRNLACETCPAGKYNSDNSAGGYKGATKEVQQRYKGYPMTLDGLGYSYYWSSVVSQTASGYTPAYVYDDPCMDCPAGKFSEAVKQKNAPAQRRSCKPCPAGVYSLCCLFMCDQTSADRGNRKGSATPGARYV